MRKFLSCEGPLCLSHMSSLERAATWDTGATVSSEGLSQMGTMGVLGIESPPGNEGVRAERGQTMKPEQNSCHQWPRNEAEEKGPGLPGASSHGPVLGEALSHHAKPVASRAT